MSRTGRLGRVGALALALVAALIAVGLRGPSIATAQEPPTLEISARFDVPEPTLGQRVRLLVTVRHAQDLIITIERPNAIPPQVDFVSAEPGSSRFDPIGSGATTTYVFVLAPFALGPIGLGDLRVGWLRSSGESGSLPVTAPPLTVVPTRSTGDDALRPLKPQVPVGGAPPGWQRPTLAVVVALAVVAAATTATFVWRRHHARARSEDVVAPDTSAEQSARAKLNELITPTRDATAHYQHFYGTLSLAVREYLRDRYGFNATALTTSELERRMVARGVGRWQARLVSGLLDRCDAAVYAHDYPDPASADHDLTLAYEIIELSRPHATVADVAVSA